MASIANNNEKTVLGIDIGTTKITISSITTNPTTLTKPSNDFTPIVLSSDTGSKSIPPLVGFRNKKRNIGETAALEENSNAKNTIKDLIYFLGTNNNNIDNVVAPNKFRQFRLVNDDNNVSYALIDYNNKETKLRLELLISMLIRTARSYSKATNIEGVSITVPVSYTEGQRKALIDAVHISEMKPMPFINTCEAMVIMFEIKHRDRIVEACNGSEEEETNNYNVILLDIGHTTTNLALAQYQVDNNNNVTSKIISSVGKSNLGARNIDDGLFNAVTSILSSKHKLDVKPASKVGSRILRQCKKAKEILSTIGETSIVLENLPGDIDARIPISKSTLEESSKYVATELEALFQTLFENCSSVVSKENVDVIEISGGGVRIPFIKKVIENAVSTTKAKCQTTLSPEASSKAAAIVAANAIVASNNGSNNKDKKVEEEEKVKKKEEEEEEEKETDEAKDDTEETTNVADTKDEETPTSSSIITSLANLVIDNEKYAIGNMKENEIEMAKSLEMIMQLQDNALAEIGDARNSLESYIYEMRSICNGNTGSQHYKLLNNEKLLPLLMEAEDWMYESDDYTKENYVEKLNEITTVFQETSPGYFEAVEKERLKLESELNEGEKIGDKERALESENAEDDHDRRKLKKDDRMRLVVRNKNEGTELFKGGVYKQAAIRYTKALQNCTKFFDLSEADEKEVNEIKVKLHLNIAMCFLKLKNNHKVINNCTDALKLDNDNVKALFRRATAYYNEKKIKEAKSDLKRAVKLNPEDKAIKKLTAKIDLVIKKQKAKEKKMAKRMFG